MSTQSTQTSVSGLLSKFDLQGAGLVDLQRAGALVAPRLDAVLERFYGFAGSDPDIAPFFPDRALLEHARGAQKRHWEALLSGRFEDGYFASADRIGRVHYRIQLPFLFYLSGYSRASSVIQEVVLRETGALLSGRARGRAGAMLGALTRAFGLDMHLVIEAYFAAQQEEQANAFRYLSEGIERMVARDLSQPIPGPEESDFPARYDGVRQSFNRLLASTREVIGTIQTAVVTLDQSAGEVSQAAEDLATRTETQAATLEETAAAVEEITGSLHSSAEATAETSAVVAETRQNATRGDAVVTDAVQKMQQIATSSSQIAQIIGVIDDIAFQTNLLALNAGVEAARAGEAGRGFAVVASEVRGLAQRAAASAKEIKTLITESGRHVEDGVSMVDQAGAALRQIVTDIGRAADLAADITTSAREQSTGVTEINTQVSHLDSVTQQNAAMVEQTTAAMVSMQRDTRGLAEMVRSFNVSAAVPAAHTRIAAE